MPDFTKGHWSVENGVDIISDFHKNAYIAQLFLIPELDADGLRIALDDLFSSIDRSEDKGHDTHA